VSRCAARRAHRARPGSRRAARRAAARARARRSWWRAQCCAGCRAGTPASTAPASTSGSRARPAARSASSRPREASARARSQSAFGRRRAAGGQRRELPADTAHHCVGICNRCSVLEAAPPTCAGCRSPGLGAEGHLGQKQSSAVKGGAPQCTASGLYSYLASAVACDVQSHKWECLCALLLPHSLLMGAHAQRARLQPAVNAPQDLTPPLTRVPAAAVCTCGAVKDWVTWHLAIRVVQRSVGRWQSAFLSWVAR